MSSANLKVKLMIISYSFDKLKSFCTLLLTKQVTFHRMTSYLCYLQVFRRCHCLLLFHRISVNLVQGAILYEFIDICVSQVIDYSPAPSSLLHCVFLPQVHFNHHGLIDLILILLRLNSR